MTSSAAHPRLTQIAHGGGCACKIPPGELEDMVRGLTGMASPDLLVGLEPKHGTAVTGIGDPDTLLRNDAASAGTPISLTTPLGVGIRAPGATAVVDSAAIPYLEGAREVLAVGELVPRGEFSLQVR